MTVVVTALSMSLGAVLAFAAGIARLLPWTIVRLSAGMYVEVFRGTSALVQLFLVFYVLPSVGVSLPPLMAGVVALGLNAGAYGSEIVRGSIKSVNPHQLEAAKALNMTPVMTFRRVVLPLAIPSMLPPFGNLTIELLKGSALVSLITINELAFTGRSLMQTTGRSTEIYLMVLLIYFVMAVPLIRLVRGLEHKAGMHRTRPAL